MLHEFLTVNRDELIERCCLKVAQRHAPKPTRSELEHGIPLFLDQLIKTLHMERMAEPMLSRRVSGPSGGGPPASEIGLTAARHGFELLRHGFTVDQVVHDYGDLCQAITDLAVERSAPIEIDEFRTLNRCLDNAIADAVTEFAYQRDLLLTGKDEQALAERLGFLGNELRKLIHTATLAITAIKSGNVGLAGATGALLDQSLAGLRNLIDRSLADVRVRAGMPARREPMSIAELIAEVQISASLEARARGCGFVALEVDPQLAVSGDREMLAAALGDLLQNAFKFTEQGTEVSLRAYAKAEHVLIEVADHCGGLAPDEAERMFDPPAENAGEKSGLGLGLSICHNSVQANGGVLRVRNVPGDGCVFIIDLPANSPTARAAILRSR